MTCVSTSSFLHKSRLPCWNVWTEHITLTVNALCLSSSHLTPASVSRCPAPGSPPAAPGGQSWSRWCWGEAAPRRGAPPAPGCWTPRARRWSCPRCWTWCRSAKPEIQISHKKLTAKIALFSANMGVSYSHSHHKCKLDLQNAREIQWSH